MSEPTEKVKYPKQVYLILVTEFCERFCYYGLRALLVLYIRNILLHPESTAKIIYHTFSGLAYLYPVVGATVSDSWFGKFRTILYFSIVYVIGTIILSLSAIKPLGLPQLTFCILGLLLIATGTGGIKPCVSSFGGDQFVLPQQIKQLEVFFYFFYFAINVGSFLSTVITPELRNTRCYGEKSCYFLGFGVPAIFMSIALVIFFLGKRLYVMVRPEFNVIIHWLKCIGKGIKGKVASKEKVAHWLDYSEEKYGKVFVQHVKETLSIIVIFLPIPLFWALFDQQGSGWTLQASQMAGKIGTFYTILPEQMVALNALLILVLIPLFSFVVYPLCGKINLLLTPLQRMGYGGIFAGISFFTSAFISRNLEADAPVLPGGGESHIRLYNPLNCSVKISALPYVKNVELESMGFQLVEAKDVKGKNFVEYTISGCDGMFANTTGKKMTVNEKETLGSFVTTNGLVNFDDDIAKHLEGFPKIRTLVGNPPNEKLRMTYWHKKKSLDFVANNYSLFALDTGTYKLGRFNKDTEFFRGGVYTILVYLDGKKVKKLKVYEVTKRNTLHILWQVPQYILITIGEVMLSPTGLEFAYTQAPISMKALMAAVWLLAVAFGNLLVVIMEAIYTFKQQSIGFFVYGTLMLLDMIIFAILARRYKYVESYKKEEDEHANTSAPK